MAHGAALVSKNWINCVIISYRLFENIHLFIDYLRNRHSESFQNHQNIAKTVMLKNVKFNNSKFESQTVLVEMSWGFLNYWFIL